MAVDQVTSTDPMQAFYNEIDGKAVKGQLDLIRGINEKKEGDVTLTIVELRNDLGNWPCHSAA